MEDIRQQQIDVLKEAVPYCEKMIGAIEKVSDELAGECFPETHDAVNVIIEGLNWLFEVYNGTRTLINEDGKSIDEKSVNEAVKGLSDAVSDNDDMALSKAMVRLAEFVKELREAGSRYI